MSSAASRTWWRTRRRARSARGTAGAALVVWLIGLDPGWQWRLDCWVVLVVLVVLVLLVLLRRPQGLVPARSGSGKTRVLEPGKVPQNTGAG